MKPRVIFFVGVALVASAGISRPPLGAHAASPIAFSTPTVIDPFRVGFEPTLAHDLKNDLIYASLPNGFSTTESFVWRSNDHGDSFHLTESNAVGKSVTCAGGGDTDIVVDPVNGNLYFADLQGLTNFSMSVSSDHGKTFLTNCLSVKGLGVDRQWLAIDSNGGTTAVASGAAAGRLYFDYDNVAQQGGANQLVMNESLDGLNYGSNCDTVPACGPPAVISANEGLPGPVVVDDNPGSTFKHSVYAVHSSSDNGSVLVSICRGKAGDTTAATVAFDCTDPTQFNIGDPNHINSNWHDTSPRSGGAGDRVAVNFPSLAIDHAGRLYATWAEYPRSSGSYSGAGSIKFSFSTDGGEHWSPPTTISPPVLNNNIFPWIVAGDDNRVDIAWYGSSTPQTSNFGPDTLNNGQWDVFFAATTAARTATAAFSPFTVSQVSDHHIKFGNVSTAGLGGSPDRSLGDYMQIGMGPRGEAEIVYVDDTSADRNNDTCTCGQTPSEAAGPAMFVKQTGGPSLLAAVGDLGPAPPNPLNSVMDPVGVGFPDAYFSNAGTDTNSSAHLDIGAASVSLADSTHLKITLDTNDPNLASNLGPDPTLGGPTNQWMVRWIEPTANATCATNTPVGNCDGDVNYVSMETDGGQGQSFFDGSTGAIFTTHAKNFTYQPDHALTPSSGGTGVSGKTITWIAPLSDFPGMTNTSTLYSVTAFTFTDQAPTQAVTPAPISAKNDVGPIGNLIDASPPFNANLSSPGPNIFETPSVPLFIGLGLIAVAGGGYLRQRRRRTAG
jgi:hypothetical protein